MKTLVILGIFFAAVSASAWESDDSHLELTDSQIEQLDESMDLFSDDFQMMDEESIAPEALDVKPHCRAPSHAVFCRSSFPWRSRWKCVGPGVGCGK